jgi:hypothetical protein
MERNELPLKEQLFFLKIAGARRREPDAEHPIVMRAAATRKPDMCTVDHLTTGHLVGEELLVL